MIETNVIQLILLTVTLIATVISVIANIKKLPTELRSGNVDLAEKYRKFAEEESTKRLKMENEISELTNKLELNKLDFKKQLEKEQKDFNEKLDKIQSNCTEQIEKQAEQLKLASDKASKFEDWARRLSAQAISLRYIPVPLDPEPPTLYGEIK